MTNPSENWPIRVPLGIGLFTLIALVAVTYIWGINSRIAGAIVASGTVEVQANRQAIQHPEGGVVGEIFKSDGDTVSAGDLLLILDDTFMRSELNIVESQLYEIWARSARLRAESQNQDIFDGSPELLKVLPNPEVSAFLAGQKRLFQARRESRSSEQAQIAEQTAQLQNRIRGIEAEYASLVIQLDLINEELESVIDLFTKGLTQASRGLALRRNAASLQGKIGHREATIAQFRGQIAELKIRALQLESVAREDAIIALRDLQPTLIELRERRLTLTERLSRLDIRAPMSGTVFGSTVFTLRSVIKSGETVMYIIPQDQPLLIAARIASIDIDQIYLGQEASLKFAAFDQRQTPEVIGQVTRLSADVLTDEVTGQKYYRADILPNSDDMSQLKGQALLPGMPADVFIKTAERSPLSYLSKPLTDYFAKAFREE